MNPSFTASPIGSLRLIKDPKQRARYIGTFLDMPTSLTRFLYSPTVGAFIRGTTKEFNIPVEQAPQLAFAVLRVAVGEVELAKLGATLSSELKLPNDKAQAIAKELEKELFTSVMLELQQFLQKKSQSQQKPTNPGVANVIDLKNTPTK